MDYMEIESKYQFDVPDPNGHIIKKELFEKSFDDALSRYDGKIPIMFGGGAPFKGEEYAGFVVNVGYVVGRSESNDNIVYNCKMSKIGAQLFSIYENLFFEGSAKTEKEEVLEFNLQRFTIDKY